jgi:hypothetical protein
MVTIVTISVILAEMHYIHRLCIFVIINIRMELHQVVSGAARHFVWNEAAIIRHDHSLRHAPT